ncbi:hypothetical protein N431DRAFT_472238 [Stipitochalara longipes BDJ]|nr:hypothetical protein N431DRAFT_472238 [Stipitochalara longipes BDJ]
MSFDNPPPYQLPSTSTIPHHQTSTFATPRYSGAISTPTHLKMSFDTPPYQSQSTSTPLHHQISTFATPRYSTRRSIPTHLQTSAFATPPPPYQFPTTPIPSLSPPHSKLQTYSDPSNHPKTPSYNLSITPLLTLQHQIHHPISATYLSPQTTNHQHQLYTHLRALYQKWKHQTLTTFYTRIKCPRCGELPISDPLYHSTSSISLQDLNHSLPREALVLWRTLRREMEGVDLLRVRQGHLECVVEGLREVERLFLEGGEGSCGEGWNGGRGGPAI